MITQMEKNTIITLKLKGKSNRQIAKEVGINRKTVALYWYEYERLIEQLQPDGDNRALQEQIISAARYDSSSRKPRKYNRQIDQAINQILEQEVQKARELGSSHKQKLTNKQIHCLLKDRGYDIGLTVTTDHVRAKRQKIAKTFIRQEYDFGDRLEYDFGEVRLIINGVAGKYYLAVFGSPKSSLRWAYLYKNQKKDVFLDSHVRFFDMVGGVYREVIYDNMKNVVTAFIGKNEKQLNTDLTAMSTYYGFSPNVTNCFRGNEKGFVESSVKKVRKEVFALRYRFDSLEQAEQYLETELIRMNAGSQIEEERKHLLPARPRLELSKMTEQKVDKYSFVRVENNFYSVPEYLTGRQVTIRSYVKEIVVYAGLHEVCRHIKKDGYEEMSVDILHYLGTLFKKPGAIRNSKALKSQADLKAVFDRYYITRARQFIAIMRTYQNRPMDEIVHILQNVGREGGRCYQMETGSNVLNHTKRQLDQISGFFIKSRVG